MARDARGFRRTAVVRTRERDTFKKPKATHRVRLWLGRSGWSLHYEKTLALVLDPGADARAAAFDAVCRHVFGPGFHAHPRYHPHRAPAFDGRLACWWVVRVVRVDQRMTGPPQYAGPWTYFFGDAYGR